MKKIQLSSVVAISLSASIAKVVVIPPVENYPIATLTLHVDKDLLGTFAFGHSFISITNHTNYSFNVGHYSLSPDETVSVGLWSTSDNNDKVGIYYNRELFRYNKNGYPSQNTYINGAYKLYDNADINRISNIIYDKNNEYDLLHYNCVNFTIDCFNAYINDSSKYIDCNNNPISFYNYVVNTIHAGFPASIDKTMYVDRSIDYYSSFSDSGIEIKHFSE